MVRVGTMVGFALLLLLAGCFDVRSRDPGIEVLPDRLGRVYPESNDLGISGNWYAYGDQYDYPSRCTTIGKHSPDECSHIYAPAVERYTPGASPPIVFYNMDGRMCTAGQVAKVGTCDETVLGCKNNLDYSNMWGAGIGLDFNLAVSQAEDRATFVRVPLDRKPWDPTTHHIAGVSFDFSSFTGEVIGPPHIRVEFPFVLPDHTPLPAGKGTVGLNPDVQPPVPVTGELPDHPSPPSEEYPSGSPIWGVSGGKWADDRFSPVHEGYNEVRFDSLGPPPETETDYMVDVSQLLGVQFHIPTWPDNAVPYDFCISNLAFFRD